jgi:hypothetical protein
MLTRHDTTPGIDYETWKGRVVRRKRDRRAELLDRAERVGPAAAVAELVEEGVPEDEIEELIEGIEASPPPPRAGGLRERLAASVAARGPPP